MRRRHKHGRAYLAEIERQRAHARSAYGLLLVPGLELTYNDPNPDRAGHALAVGLHSFVAMDDGQAAAMEEARAVGAAILAAHPHDSGPTQAVPSPTCYFARRWRELRGLFDRVELFNGRQPVQLGRGGRTTGHRLRRPAPGRTPSRLDDARSLRAGRGGARRLPALVPPSVPDAARAAHRRARRAAGPATVLSSAHIRVTDSGHSISALSVAPPSGA